MTLSPLPDLLIEPMVRAALMEDLGRAGDLTTDAIIPAGEVTSAVLVARHAGVLAGVDFARMAFRLVEPKLGFEAYRHDGDPLAAGETIARVFGPTRGILTGERVALNYLTHLSGIATATAAYVAALKGTQCKISCTRKTLPGLRAAQKYAVRAGGGMNHRFGLDDAILIKDNHIAAAGGVAPAIERARAHAGHMVKIEIEVDDFDQLETALEAGADMILLDNMSLEALRRAVAFTNGRARLEASGGVTLESAADIAATGVDLVSSGALTHSVRTLDIGLDFR